jgi:tRNA(fMet)-specific endonuclease VapC
VSYLLDTNAVIALLKNRPRSVRNRLRRVASGGTSVAVSTVVLYELWYGVARSERRRENAERLRVFLSGNIDVAPFDEERMLRLPATCVQPWKRRGRRLAPMTC